MHAAMGGAEEHPWSPDLVQNLRKALLDLSAHPYPTIESPPETPRRASVALVLRIQPHYKYWPPKSEGLGEKSQFISKEERINAFFDQEWVQHGDPEALFIKRAARKGDRWTSHVAFPGGRRDPEDADDQAAAAREAYEEVGLELSEGVAISTGNLPQKLVTAAWGKMPVMVLCPYIFLLTSHTVPALRLQPTEVASAHWVPVRALISPAQRTLWYQDVSSRTSGRDFGFKRSIHRAMIGKMMFAAVRLIPSESVYCTSIDEFIPTQPAKATSADDPINANVTVPLIGASWYKPPSPVDSPLLLWGLTLGVMSDFLDLLPPHMAMRQWVYPTFSPLDMRFVLWLLSYNFRKRKQKELEEGYQVAVPVVERGLDIVGVQNGLVEKTEAAKADGMGAGWRHYGRVRNDQRGFRSDAFGSLMQGYYTLVRRAVEITLVGRLSLLAVVLWIAYRKLRRSLFA